MSKRKIDPVQFFELEKLATASGLGSVRALVQRMIDEYRTTHPADAWVADNVLGQLHEKAVDTNKGGL